MLTFFCSMAHSWLLRNKIRLPVICIFITLTVSVLTSSRYYWYTCRCCHSFFCPVPTSFGLFWTAYSDRCKQCLSTCDYHKDHVDSQSTTAPAFGAEFHAWTDEQLPADAAPALSSASAGRLCQLTLPTHFELLLWLWLTMIIYSDYHIHLYYCSNMWRSIVHWFRVIWFVHALYSGIEIT